MEVGNNSYDSPKRMLEIDIIKAIGIICVVLGHSGSPATKFVYLFHIAIFVIASGFFYKGENGENFQQVYKSVLKKARQLWWPFFLANTIFILLHNFFILIYVYTDSREIFDYVDADFVLIAQPYSPLEVIKKIIQGAFFQASEQIFGACWFLQTLFMVSVLYLLIDYLIKLYTKKSVCIFQFVVAVCLLFVGYILKKNGTGYTAIGRMASCYFLYYFGHVFSLVREKLKLVDLNWKKAIVVIIFSLGMLLLLGPYGEISLDENYYSNPVFLVVCSLCGWLFLYGCSMLIKRDKVLGFLGKHTLTILVFHFLAMKIVAVILTRYYKIPVLCIAAFPNLYGNKAAWWLLYTVVGVSLPANIDYVICRIKERWKTECE